MEACNRSERTDADQDGGDGDDACVVNPHANPSKSHDDAASSSPWMLPMFG